MQNIKLVLFILLFSETTANSMNQKFKVEYEEKEIKEEGDLITDLTNDIVKYQIVPCLGVDGSTPINIAESIKHILNLRTISKKWKKVLTPRKIKELIQKSKIDVNLKDEKANTALHFVAQRNYIQAAKILIAMGADVNAMGSSSFVLIEHIFRNGYTRILYDLHKLLKFKDLIDDNLRNAIENGRIDLPKVSIRAQEVTPFLDACFSNNLEIALLLLANGSENSIFKNLTLEIPFKKRVYMAKGAHLALVNLASLLSEDIINKINSLDQR